MPPFPLFLGWKPKILIFRHMQVILLVITSLHPTFIPHPVTSHCIIPIEIAAAVTNPLDYELYCALL